MMRHKVLHVFKYFRPHFTGEGTFFERIAPVFRDLRPDVGHDALCTLSGAPPSALEPLDGIGAVDYLQPRHRKSALTIVELFMWTLRNARRYDTLHYHTHVDRLFVSYLLASVLGTRIVLSSTLDDSVAGIANSYRPIFRPLVRWLCRRFDAIVAISPKLYEENVADTGRELNHLIPMGIRIPTLDPDRKQVARARLKITADAIVLVSVGGISERKDQMTLVRALPGLRAMVPNLLLLLVGPVMEEPYAQELQSFIRQNGLQNNVRFEGWVAQPWTHYAAADVMVFASREEGFGTAMIEAMAFTLPVVARRLKGVNDTFIMHGETGFLYDAEEEFGDLLRRLLANQAERERIGLAARAYAAPRFSMERAAAHYLEVYGFPAKLASAREEQIAHPAT